MAQRNSAIPTNQPTRIQVLLRHQNYLTLPFSLILHWLFYWEFPPKKIQAASSGNALTVQCLSTTIHVYLTVECNLFVQGKLVNTKQQKLKFWWNKTSPDSTNLLSVRVSAPLEFLLQENQLIFPRGKALINLNRCDKSKFLWKWNVACLPPKVILVILLT